MADDKITQLTEVTTPALTDVLAIVTGVGGTPETKKIAYNNLVPQDGWINSNETWTYVSASTFTVSGDVTTTYQKGTFLRWKQGGGWKYGVVASSAYAAPNTTVTIIVNIDYTVANATITDPWYSYAANPQGFPAWFNLPAPTLTASGAPFTNQPTTNVWKLQITGKLVTVLGQLLNHATSGATGIFTATFSSGILPTQVDYSLPLGIATNISIGKSGPAWAQNYAPLTIRFYDSSGGMFDTLAGNGEYYHVQISIPLS